MVSENRTKRKTLFCAFLKHVKPLVPINSKVKMHLSLCIVAACYLEGFPPPR